MLSVKENRVSGVKINANVKIFAPAAGYVPQTKVQLPNSTKSPAVLILAVNPVEFLGFYPPYPLFWKCCETQGGGKTSKPSQRQNVTKQGIRRGETQGILPVLIGDQIFQAVRH